MNKQGFTLMEILAVLLVLAVIASFAAPMVRRVRDEVRYQQARSAALKMADAIRSYYQNTKGYYPEGCIGPTPCTSAETAAGQTCSNVAATGIPSTATTKSVSIAQLFACDYLNAKDFAGLPYSFASEQDLIQDDKRLVHVKEQSGTGAHKNDVFYVDRDLTITDRL